MRYRYVRSRDFVDLGTPTVETVATNAAFPVARLADWRHPSRSWRSTGVVSGSTRRPILRWSPLTPTDNAGIVAIVLLQTNLARVNCAVSTAPVIQGGSRLTGRRDFYAETDPRDGRRRLEFRFGDVHSATGNGIVAILLSGRDGDTTAPYLDVGAVIGLPAWTELGANPRSPTTMRLVQPQQRGGSRDYPEEVNAGPAYLTDEWEVVTDSAAELARWRAFARLGPDDAVLWDYRDGGLYLMRPARIEIEEGRFIHTIRASWRQVV